MLFKLQWLQTEWMALLAGIVAAFHNQFMNTFFSLPLDVQIAQLKLWIDSLEYQYNHHGYSTAGSCPPAADQVVSCPPRLQLPFLCSVLQAQLPVLSGVENYAPYTKESGGNIYYIRHCTQLGAIQDTGTLSLTLNEWHCLDHRQALASDCDWTLHLP